MKSKHFSLPIAFMSLFFSCEKRHTSLPDFVSYVNPLIETQDAGNTLVGPLRPHGMVKPGPDNVSAPLSGNASPSDHSRTRTAK